MTADARSPAADGRGAAVGESLDWPVLVDAWAGRAMTRFGAAAVRAAAPLPSAAAVRGVHDLVDEWVALDEADVDTGLGAVLDVRGEVDRASRGEVLDDADLKRGGTSLWALDRMGRAFRAVSGAPGLSGIASVIDLDLEVIDLLDGAWDNTGLLSAARWPRLGELREQIGGLHERVRRTLDELVTGDAMADVLQDRFWTERDRRYVVPLKHYAKGHDLGIVHGVSRTGQTVFVEPHQVIALNNALRVAEGELLAEEHRVRTLLSRALGTQRAAVFAALDAATELDLIASRAGFARALGCVRPAVGDGGAIDLRAARHPVLALRGVAVVPNDLQLSQEHAALVISGPNAGGKTVALKTVGLCALLVQHGCFVPAQEGSRVDRFDAVLAAIGDQQTVHGDLSSFSGHLLALQRILDAAAPGTLALLDELASGTDPAQGAALAQAVLEVLLDRGARLVVTTHFARLKGLAAADPRFAMAATQLIGGNPTYRLISGTTGESRAFELARRMGLDEALVARAEGLMEGGEQALGSALERLEAERGRAEQLAREVEAQRRDLSRREAALAERELRIAKRSKELEEQGAEAFLSRLRDAEKAIGQVVAGLQRDPSHKGVKAAEASLVALRGLLPAVEAEATDTPAPRWSPGDRVRLVALGKPGEVLEVGPRSVKVRSGGVTLTVKPGELLPEAPGAVTTTPKPATRRSAASTSDLDEAVRHGGNTLDLRGRRFEESTDLAEAFFDRAVLGGQEEVFLLHGHGTGALKSGLRGWLGGCRYVARWSPASEEQGGDAFTVVRLR